jgi:hypothetical protein
MTIDFIPIRNTDNAVYDKENLTETTGINTTTSRFMDFESFRDYR